MNPQMPTTGDFHTGPKLPFWLNRILHHKWRFYIAAGFVVLIAGLAFIGIKMPWKSAQVVDRPSESGLLQPSDLINLPGTEIADKGSSGNQSDSDGSPSDPAAPSTGSGGGSPGGRNSGGSSGGGSGGGTGGGGTGGGSGGGCSTTDPWAPGGPDPWGGCWPGPNNTGVPAGVVLSAYTGSCTITAQGTVINARTVNCSPLTIRAANVTITKSRLNGGVNVESAYCGTASFTITDSHVDIPSEVSGNSGSTGILRCNFHANRVNVTGGRRSMYCVSNCTIENSWVHEHGVDPNAQAHFSGIRMEQGGTIRHNTITCEATRSGPGSGCSAGLTGYPDFAPVTDNLIERNLFYRGGAGGSTMCAYGGATSGKPYSNDSANATHIRFISNRFVRGANGHCGNLGTILHFNINRTGNVWTDNLYHTGAAISSSGP